MIDSMLSAIDAIFHFPDVFAHCDIPCGIYDPNDMIEAAKTVLKMQKKMAELPKESPTPDDRNSFVRMVMVKEEHARKCKDDLLVLWTDYFKPEHLERVSGLHETVWMAAKAASKAKQSSDPMTGEALVKACQEIAEMFETIEGAPKKE